MLGRLAELGAYVKTHRIDVIFVALPIRHVARVMQLLDDLRDTTASIYYVPDIFVFDLIQARAGEIQGMPVVALCETPFAGYRGAIKRAMDVSVALGRACRAVAAAADDRDGREDVLARARRSSASAATASTAARSSSTSSAR